MVSCRIFKSLSHFEFIFVHGVRVCSSFIALHAAVQVSQHPFSFNGLSIASFETIFSHSVSCLFVFFWVSFAVQKLFSLIRSHWLLLLLFLLFWENDLRKNL